VTGYSSGPKAKSQGLTNYIKHAYNTNMARLKLPPDKKLSAPVFVLLRQCDLRRLDAIAAATKKTRSFVMREAFLDRYRKGLTSVPKAQTR